MRKLRISEFMDFAQIDRAYKGLRQGPAAQDCVTAQPVLMASPFTMMTPLTDFTLQTSTFFMQP